jgi:hypothetical protein
VQELLASASWDGTVRLWDVFSGKGGTEVLQHNRDVLALAYRPDGKQLASCTLDAQISFWDPFEGVLVGTIEGRRDIAGGRLVTDRQTAASSAAGKCFYTLAYSADGAYLVAGGNSKFVCMYDVAEKVRGLRGVAKCLAVGLDEELRGLKALLPNRLFEDSFRSPAFHCWANSILGLLGSYDFSHLETGTLSYGSL